MSDSHRVIKWNCRPNPDAFLLFLLFYSLVGKCKTVFVSVLFLISCYEMLRSNSQGLEKYMQSCSNVNFF